MRNEVFKKLVAEIRGRWTAEDGLTVGLYKRSTFNHDMMTLCAGQIRNRDMVARNCVVWQNDSKVYDGPIDSVDLQKLLTQHGVCIASFNTVRNKARTRQRLGYIMCLGDPQTCKEDCKLKGTGHAEQKALPGTAEGVRGSGDDK